MSRRIIPKEKLSSCRSWEMEAFERRRSLPPDDEHDRQCDATGEDRRDQGTLGEKSEAEHDEPSSAEGYGHGYEAGQKAGYEAGYGEGRNSGYQAGYEAGMERAVDEAKRLEALLQEFQRELSTADQVIGQDLLSLALSLAKQMAREALRIKPEIVCTVVRECLRHEPGFNQPKQLFLNVEDAELVRKYLDQELEGWVICVEPQIERGGCRIKMGHGEIDATTETRWLRIAQSLGQSSAWME
ncbi:MAG TPA: flagellar assembly protein FliH [Nitrosospira sp.]|nr:flagellar assembly protein FliH [Nitrosospira sp.]